VVIARLRLALFSFAGINHRCPLPPFIAIPSRLPPASRQNRLAILARFAGRVRGPLAQPPGWACSTLACPARPALGPPWVTDGDASLDYRRTAAFSLLYGLLRRKRHHASPLWSAGLSLRLAKPRPFLVRLWIRPRSESASVRALALPVVKPRWSHQAFQEAKSCAVEMNGRVGPASVHSASHCLNRS